MTPETANNLFENVYIIIVICGLMFLLYAVIKGEGSCWRAPTSSSIAIFFLLSALGMWYFSSKATERAEN